MEASQTPDPSATPPNETEQSIEEQSQQESSTSETPDQEVQSDPAEALDDQSPPPVPVEPGVGEAPPAAPASGDPAAEQSPVATANQAQITGDPGFGEQAPRQPIGNVDTPHASSAPPPEAQSGVPLPEDRAAGVQGGQPGMTAPPAPELPGGPSGA